MARSTDWREVAVWRGFTPTAAGQVAIGGAEAPGANCADRDILSPCMQIVVRGNTRT